jgi:hypothetical protein
VRRARRRVRERFYYFRSELKYLEFHLTEHCNLNCKGCYHFSNIAPESFADLEIHRRDMNRLPQVFRNIHKIRLMGGEPLQHPEVHEFIRTTRSSFPKADVGVITNGVLLPQASAQFWDACRETRTGIHLTVYPPMAKKVPDYSRLCENNGVELHLTYVDEFMAHYNPKGDSDKEIAFKECRKMYFCPFLQDGRIYCCFMTPTVHYFNDKFGKKVAGDPGLDIHSDSMTGREILRYLDRPIETCRWCTHDFVPFKWEQGRKDQVPTDWGNASEGRQIPL